jgi:hypothetical protein
MIPFGTAKYLINDSNLEGIGAMYLLERINKGSIGQTWRSLGVGGRSFLWKWSARNGGVL